MEKRVDISILLGQPRRSLAATRSHLRRKKKVPTRIYKERDHTAEGLMVLQAILHCFLQEIFALQAKIQSFFIKDYIDHANKVYKGIIIEP